MRFIEVCTLAAVGWLGAACATGSGPSLLSGASYASYQPATALTTYGYSEREIDDTHVEVRAVGTEATSKERVERIALARAAELGEERGLKAFKVLSVKHGIACRQKREVYRSTVPALRALTVTLDVVYSKEPVASDPAFLASSETFARVRAELDQDLYMPETAAAATAAIRSQCPG